MLKWFNLLKLWEPISPHHNVQIQKKEVVKIIAANDSISSYMPGKCKRCEYSSYSPERRAKIAKLAVEIGVAKSARKMLVELGKIF